MAKKTKKPAGKSARKPAPKKTKVGAPRPAAPLRMDDCPRGDCCLWRLGLVGRGEIRHKLGPPFPCPIAPTQSGSGSLEIELKSTGLPCDEPHVPIPDGSKLNAAIHTIRREDDLAFICGTFTIYDPNQKPLFQGNIDLYHRVNTHYPPFGPDPCDRRDHLQGRLNGSGIAKTRTEPFLLRAMLVARTDPLNGGTAGYAIGLAHINGVVIKCKG